MILPQSFAGNSQGENEVWRAFGTYLSSDFVSFHNYYLGLKQPDIILLVPRLGILIIEIKGFLAKNIIDVPDRAAIRLKHQPPEPSPFDQVIRYRNLLMEDFLGPNGINSVYVTCAVCYPYVTREDYLGKGLNKISDERFTITAEYLVNAVALQDKILDIFKHTYAAINVPGLIKYGFEGEVFEKVGNLVSPGFRDAAPPPPEEPEEAVPVRAKRTLYSRFLYVRDAADFGPDKLDELFALWEAGTNIYFYSANAVLAAAVRDRLCQRIELLGLADREGFGLSEGSTFLFHTGVSDALKHDLVLSNGEGFESCREDLKALHDSSNFNLGQFEIEHGPLEDTIVKAGAGTGKTYSIISRINFLVWKKEYTPKDLCRAVAMITFTNESADDMKKKLSKNFLNHYLLTRDPVYLQYIECVEDMNISTIHSMSRKILQKYSARIALGKNFRIVSGNFQRRRVLHEKLNDYMVAHPRERENIAPLTMFHLEARLSAFLEKLDNKNVDIVADRGALQFGSATNPVFDGLLDVLRETQRETNAQCDRNNSVSLGDLIRKLRVLSDKLAGAEATENEQVDFLFVDEFQDTDDNQIELMKRLRGFFGYRFFAVGDVKQCIYRFRGAEVRAFDTLQSGLPPIRTIPLNKNYRTDVYLMDALNGVFGRWDSERKLDYHGADILTGTKHYCDGPELLRQSHTGDEDFAARLVDTIVTCRDALASPKDKVALLVRYNWQASEVRALCEDRGVHVETDIGGELFRIDPTIDMFKLLQALRYNRSPNYLYNLFTTSYTRTALPKAELWGLASGDEVVKDFYDNLPTGLEKWNQYIWRLRSEPVLKVLRDIVDESKPWNAFAQKTGSTPEEQARCESYYIRNLDQLFEKLALTANTDYLTLNKLTDYLEIMILTRREEEARESYDVEHSTAKVICTTVHKSKGLEFDTVILPYCDFNLSTTRPRGDVDLIYSGNQVGYQIRQKIGDTERLTVFENDLYQRFRQDEYQDRAREETRILYVAFTRAKRRVVYFVDNSGARTPTECWKRLIGGNLR